MSRPAQEGVPRTRLLQVRVTESLGETVDAVADGNLSNYLRSVIQDDLSMRGLNP